MEKQYTINELAEVLGFSRQTIHQWIVTGQLNGWKANGLRGMWRIPQSAIDEFIKKNSINQKAS